MTATRQVRSIALLPEAIWAAASILRVGALAVGLAIGGAVAAAAQDGPAAAPAQQSAPIERGGESLEEGPGASGDPGPGEAPAFGGGARDYLDAREFRRRYENKTVHLLFGSDHYGSEYYLPNDRSIWIAADGPCQLGDWSYVTPQFCFQYGNDGPHCWTVFDQEGETYAESVEGLRLRIYAVEERPLNCDPGLFS